MFEDRRIPVLFTAALLCFTTAHSQTKKFPAPASADTIKNILKGDETSIVNGKKIYIQYCVTCHGDKGKGDGIAAPGLSKPPADHSSGFVQNQTDGALFWIITRGNIPMPAYGTTLTVVQRWQVVNYIRTLAKKSKK
jgi:mono/diheme cytochrome c family protein